MSIETILPWVISECGLDVTAPDIASQDFQMRQVAALMNAAGKDINTRVEWGDAKKYEIIPGDSATFALPVDWQRMAGSGAISLEKNEYTPVRPVTDPTMWQFLRRDPSATQMYYLVDRDQVNFSSTLDSDGAVMHYISTYWLDGNKDAITNNEDETIFPEELLARGTIWRWKRQKGLEFQDLMAEFEADLQTAINADRGA